MLFMGHFFYDADKPGRIFLKFITTEFTAKRKEFSHVWLLPFDRFGVIKEGYSRFYGLPVNRAVIVFHSGDFGRKIFLLLEYPGSVTIIASAGLFPDFSASFYVPDSGPGEGAFVAIKIHSGKIP